MCFVENLQYGVKIFVITSFKDTCYIEINPHVQRSKRGNNIKSLVLFILIMQIYAATGQSEELNHLCFLYIVIFLSFWAEVHYNSIYPLGGMQCNHVIFCAN